MSVVKSSGLQWYLEHRESVNQLYLETSKAAAQMWGAFNANQEASTFSSFYGTVKRSATPYFLSKLRDFAAIYPYQPSDLVEEIEYLLKMLDLPMAEQKSLYKNQTSASNIQQHYEKIGEMLWAYIWVREEDMIKLLSL